MVKFEVNLVNSLVKFVSKFYLRLFPSPTKHHKNGNSKKEDKKYPL